MSVRTAADLGVPDTFNVATDAIKAAITIEVVSASVRSKVRTIAIAPVAAPIKSTA